MLQRPPAGAAVACVTLWWAMRTLFAVFLVVSLGGCVNSSKPPPDGVLDPRGEK